MLCLVTQKDLPRALSVDSVKSYNDSLCIVIKNLGTFCFLPQREAAALWFSGCPMRVDKTYQTLTFVTKL